MIFFREQGLEIKEGVERKEFEEAIGDGLSPTLSLLTISFSVVSIVAETGKAGPGRKKPVRNLQALLEP